MTTKREKAAQVISRMLPPESAAHLLNAPTEKSFGDELSQLAMSNVFEQLWTRDVIDARTRSLITIGILIALRGSNELATHFPAAVRNGASLAEIEEMLAMQFDRFCGVGE